MDGACDVLQRDLAQVLGIQPDLVAYLVIDFRGGANSARRRQGSPAGGNIHAVAVDIVTIADALAKIYADAQDNRRRYFPILFLRMRVWSSIAAWTAFMALPNSSSVPSPINLMIRPL